MVGVRGCKRIGLGVVALALAFAGAAEAQHDGRLVIGAKVVAPCVVGVTDLSAIDADAPAVACTRSAPFSIRVHETTMTRSEPAQAWRTNDPTDIAQEPDQPVQDAAIARAVKLIEIAF